MFELFDPKAELWVGEGASLPHWYQPGVTYFITFRTGDSIPVPLLRHWHKKRDLWLLSNGISPSDQNWRALLSELPAKLQLQFHEQFSKSFMEFLDRGLGECLLSRKDVAEVIHDSLLHFDGVRYHMGDFVIMPNHVHLLVCLIGNTDLVTQCYSWKKFTASRINAMVGRSGRLWQEESFDHLVRSPYQFEAIQRYIRKNPEHLSEDRFVLYSLDQK